MKLLILATFSALFAFAQDSVEDWTKLNGEGVGFFQAGDFGSAERRFRAALLDAETFGAADPRYWATLTNLGLALERRADLSAAEAILRRVAELREKTLGPQDASVAHALVNVAVVLHLMLRDAEAEPLLRRALADASQNEIFTAEALNTLGLTLMDLGDYARAEPIMRRAISIFEKLQGAESLEVAKASNNLAMLYTAERDFGKAEYELRHAIPLYEKSAGPAHPELIGPLNNMFTVLGAQKRFDDGEPFLRRALAIAEKESSDVLRVVQLRSNLGALEAHRGNYREAAKIFQDVIATEEHAFGPDDPQLAGPLRAYSDALRHLHQSTEAKSAGDRAKAIKASAPNFSFMPR